MSFAAAPQLDPLALAVVRNLAGLFEKGQYTANPGEVLPRDTDEATLGRVYDELSAVGAIRAYLHPPCPFPHSIGRGMSLTVGCPPGTNMERFREWNERGVEVRWEILPPAAWLARQTAKPQATTKAERRTTSAKRGNPGVSDDEIRKREKADEDWRATGLTRKQFILKRGCFEGMSVEESVAYLDLCHRSAKSRRGKKSVKAS